MNTNTATTSREDAPPGSAGVPPACNAVGCRSVSLRLGALPPWRRERPGLSRGRVPAPLSVMPLVRVCECACRSGVGQQQDNARKQSEDARGPDANAAADIVSEGKPPNWSGRDSDAPDGSGQVSTAWLGNECNAQIRPDVGYFTHDQVVHDSRPPFPRGDAACSALLRIAGPAPASAQPPQAYRDICGIIVLKPRFPLFLRAFRAPVRYCGQVAPGGPPRSGETPRPDARTTPLQGVPR